MGRDLFLFGVGGNGPFSLILGGSRILSFNLGMCALNRQKKWGEREHAYFDEGECFA